MVTVFILEKHIKRKFFEYTYKVKLAKFQLPSFRHSAVTNEKSLGGGGGRFGKIGLKAFRRGMPDSVMLSSIVLDFHAGLQSCGTGTVTNSLLDFSSESRKTQAEFASKKGVFHSTCKPERESIFCQD